jgi:anaerobic selenocysteine-containing dehydrogenase
MSVQIKKTAHGGCPHDCPDTCAMIYEVENGKLVGVKGNPVHPMTRGGLCVKLKDYEKRHYHPDNLVKNINDVTKYKQTIKKKI